MIIGNANEALVDEVKKDREARQKEADEAMKANQKEADEIQKGHGETGNKISNKALKAMKLSEALFEDAPARYSDGKEGKWWYFTAHGVQPGSIPSDLNVLEVKDTPNGTYVALDGILNTDELQEYDMKEKTPPELDSNSDDDLNFSPFLDENLSDDEMKSFEKELYEAVKNVLQKYHKVEANEAKEAFKKIFSALKL